MPTLIKEQVPIPPPAYHRAQARLSPALHIDALTLVNTLHLLTLCRLAVRLAHQRCPPPLPAGPGGAPRTYREESLLLIALLRTLWRLSYQNMRDWLRDWPALALACGLPLDKDGCPRIPCASQQWKRGQRAGAPLPEALFVLTVLTENISAPPRPWKRRARMSNQRDGAMPQSADPRTKMTRPLKKIDLTLVTGRSSGQSWHALKLGICSRAHACER
jgi:hypothetical protein